MWNLFPMLIVFQDYLFVEINWYRKHKLKNSLRLYSFLEINNYQRKNSFYLFLHLEHHYFSCLLIGALFVFLILLLLLFYFRIFFCEKRSKRSVEVFNGRNLDYLPPPAPTTDHDRENQDPPQAVTDKIDSHHKRWPTGLMTFTEVKDGLHRCHRMPPTFGTGLVNICH